MLTFIIRLVFFCSVLVPIANSSENNVDELYSLALDNKSEFVNSLTRTSDSDIDKASIIAKWLTANFQWTETDYANRTVDEIILRKGGNCAELARVTTTMLDVLGLKYRRIKELNLYKTDDSRQARAAQRVIEIGPRGSVFGKNHNDHVWIEIWDPGQSKWLPADPTLGVVGTYEWNDARLKFGKRSLLDPAAIDILNPFAIFALDEYGKPLESRTTHYLIDGFDQYYGGLLSGLSSWNDWVLVIELLDEHAKKTLLGKLDLHTKKDDIEYAKQVYAKLRNEYELSQGH